MTDLAHRQIHALEWIKRYGRYLRSISASDLRRALARPRRTCTWCGVEVAGRRLHWCGQACVEGFRSRCDPAQVRRLVYRRDQGICYACSLDTEAARRRLRDASDFYRVFGRHERSRELLFASSRLTPPWQADHIVPVVEGGGLCGLENYRTLCLACHKRESAALAGRLASARKPPASEVQLELWD